MALESELELEVCHVSSSLKTRMRVVVSASANVVEVQQQLKTIRILTMRCRRRQATLDDSMTVTKA